MPMSKKKNHRKRAHHKAAPRGKGSNLCCDICGREIMISDWGTSESTMYCCGKPMKGR